MVMHLGAVQEFTVGMLEAQRRSRSKWVRVAQACNLLRRAAWNRQVATAAFASDRRKPAGRGDRRAAELTRSLRGALEQAVLMEQAPRSQVPHPPFRARCLSQCVWCSAGSTWRATLIEQHCPLFCFSWGTSLYF